VRLVIYFSDVYKDQTGVDTPETIYAKTWCSVTKDCCTRVHFPTYVSFKKPNCISRWCFSFFIVGNYTFDCAKLNYYYTFHENSRLQTCVRKKGATSPLRIKSPNETLHGACKFDHLQVVKAHSEN
jgi:hypothetical protein